MVNKEDEQIGDIELYEFFKGFSCGHFNLNYSHDAHCWNIQSGYTSVEISREELVKLEFNLKKLALKYFPNLKQKPLEYIPEK